MEKVIKTTKERIEYVLAHNFDDIKRSEYMDKIREDWDVLSTLCLTGEKLDNCYIACEQIASFLVSDYEVYNDVVKSKLYRLLNTKLDNIVKFEDSIFGIVIFVYLFMPLSEYNFQELLKAYCKVDLNKDEVLKIMNSENFEFVFKETVVMKIIDIINGEYE